MVTTRASGKYKASSSYRIESEISAKTNQRYSMEVILQPPSRSRPGQTLQPPIVVELKDRCLSNRVDNLSVEAKNLFACASVVSEDGLVALAPPQPNLLRGGFSDSIHPGFSSDGKEQGYYFRFTDLQIQQVGKYRIRILLVKMPTTGRSSAAVNLESVVTRVIHVDANATAPLLGKAVIGPTAGLMQTLKFEQSRRSATC